MPDPSAQGLAQKDTTSPSSPLSIEHIVEDDDDSSPRRVMAQEAWSLDWVPRAACRGTDIEQFFPDFGEPEESAIPAKRICRRCEVRGQCLVFAIMAEARQPDQGEWGVYGGLTPRERRAWIKKHTPNVTTILTS